MVRKPSQVDEQLAVAYMTYLIDIRDELPYEVMCFMDETNEFKGFCRHMDEDSFDLLYRLWTKRWPRDHKMVKKGRMPSKLQNIIDDEFEAWQRKVQYRMKTGIYEDSEDEDDYSEELNWNQDRPQVYSRRGDRFLCFA